MTIDDEIKPVKKLICMVYHNVTYSTSRLSIVSITNRRSLISLIPDSQ